MELNCPLCARLGSLDAWPAVEVVWTFPHSVAFLGDWQFYEGYCLLVSRRHATELSGLDDPERRAFLDEMCLLARAIEQAYRPHKLNYELLGNQVPHLHWHLFPRSQADPDHLKPVWLALEAAGTQDEARRRRMVGSSDRARIAGTVRRQLEALGAATA